MATTFKELFGSSGQAITITLASLANGSSRASTVVDNSTNLYLDAMLGISVKSAAASTSSTGYVTVYAYGTANGGTNYTEGATGSDAAITLTSPTNLTQVGIINVVANATTYHKVFNVAQAFGGTLPEKWGIVVTNSTGAALDSTEGNHLKVYQGVYTQGV